MTGRILALDYGSKNIGLAWCDELRILVQPLTSFPRRRKDELLKHLQTMISEHDIRELVIGLPINMDGSVGDAAQKVTLFAAFLQASLPIPVRAVDERLSTLEALEIWNSMSAKQKQKYRTVDSLAAANILRRYLEEP
jgi:putative holliday junction resolvase